MGSVLSWLMAMVRSLCSLAHIAHPDPLALISSTPSYTRQTPCTQPEFFDLHPPPGPPCALCDSLASHLPPCLPQGLYTELDFRNEALNAQRMRQLLDESEFKSADVIIPSPYMEYTTRCEG